MVLSAPRHPQHCRAAPAAIVTEHTYHIPRPFPAAVHMALAPAGPHTGQLAEQPASVKTAQLPLVSTVTAGRGGCELAFYPAGITTLLLPIPFLGSCFSMLLIAQSILITLPGIADCFRILEVEG